jgi:plasmid replication initiation protein
MFYCAMFGHQKRASSMKKQENALVVKSNRLVEASYRLDIAEQRLILMAIHEARETGLGVTSNNFLTIRADEYAAMFGLDQKSTYKQLKTAVETLYQRSVRLHDIHPESGKERITDVRWVSSAAYVEGAGLVQLKFGDDVVPFITVLEREFTSYKIKSVAQMTSTYAIRLYELLIQWKDVGKRNVDLDELKNMLGVSKEYPALFNFKARVLDVAVAQVTEFSDLDVRYENVKFGRKVTGFMFFFAAKQEPEPAPKPKAVPKKTKAPTPPKLNIAAFAGLEAYAFKALLRDFDFMTEDYVRQMMGKLGLDAMATMKQIREDMSPDNFTLKKTD